MKKRVSEVQKKLETNKFFLVGNNLSLDFINTEIVENGEAKDLLDKSSDLLAWVVATKLLKLPEAEGLGRIWDAKFETTDFLAPIKNFRKILRGAIEKLTRGKRLLSSTIDCINEILRAKTGFVEIAATIQGYEKLFRVDFTEPDRILTAVAESAADLFVYGNLDYLRKCENPACVLYFYDTTKNHRRRWCSMAGCGNRAKAAAFYRRQREQIKRSA